MKKMILLGSVVLASITAQAQKRFLHLKNSTGSTAFEVSVGGDAAIIPCRGPVCPILPTPVPTATYYNVDATIDFTCTVMPPIVYQQVNHMDLYLMSGGGPASWVGFDLCGISVSRIYPVTFPGFGTYNLSITVGPNDYTIEIL